MQGKCGDEAMFPFKGNVQRRLTCLALRRREFSEAVLDSLPNQCYLDDIMNSNLFSTKKGAKKPSKLEG